MIADYEGDITKLFEGGENGEVPVLATRNLVLFPGVVSPVLIGRTSSLSLINYLKDRPDEAFAVFCQKNADEDNPIRKDQLYEYGVHAKIIRALEMPGQSGNVTVILQGLGRCRLTGIEGTEPFLRGTVEVAPEKFPDEKDKEFMAAIEDLRSTTAEYVKKNDEIPDEAQFALQNINNPVILLNFISTSLPFDAAEKIKLLKANSMKDRLFKLLKILHREMQLLELKHDIRTKTREDIDEQQREYFLQQQIKNIKEELTGGDSYPERKELTDKAEKKKWPEEIEEVFNKELEKLDILNPQSPEFSVQLTYLQTLVGLPWESYTQDDLNLKRAEKVLDRDHYGMKKVKERILEHMAVLSLRKDLKSPIVCLYGPPGVGKTSLGKSVAAAMKRQYARISLGGVHDEAEIRGHRRTYIGAMPGRIIKSIQKAGSSNPVFILDEIDKVTQNTINGDPASALLEVLDPEQNFAFHDNYLDVDYDLS